MRIMQSQITFFYYKDVQVAADFYGETLGLELVEDQKWAKIYRVNGTAFLGIVAGEKGFHQAQEKNAVLVTFLVDDVPAWYNYLESKGVTFKTDLMTKDDIQVQCFFAEDPGGYSLEFQRFLKPELAEIFHQ
jgi:catechol 2,3-dioxygenase-like lactoylglutathione lyase family enzyme